MKTSDVVYVVIAAGLRLAAILIVLYGIFMALMPLVMGAGNAIAMLARLSLGMLIPAAILWFGSKALAALVVNGLDEPRT
jgi:hypothetical protein